MNATLPLLAAGDGLGAVIVVLIMVASGVINYLKERRAEANRKRQLEEESSGYSNDQLRGEIDKFLSEVEQANRGQSSTRQETALELTDADVIDERPNRKAATKRAAQQAQQRKQQQQLEQEEKRQAVSQRHLKDSKLGKVGQRQVSSQVRDHHLQSQVEGKHLNPEADLGTGGVSTAAASASLDSAHPLAALLSSADGVRNAVILNEVLGPPLCRRKARP